MSHAPMHFRKLKKEECGAFGQLPFYVRATAAMILKFCDDDGKFVLGGKPFVDAVSRKCGAEPNERRALAAHIEKLIAVGYLRIGKDCLIVVEQAEEAERLANARETGHPPSSRPRSSARPTSSRPLPSTARRLPPSKEVQDVAHTLPTRSESEPSTRNHSPESCREEKRRKDKEEKEGAPPTAPSVPTRRNIVETETPEPEPMTLATPDVSAHAQLDPGEDPRLVAIRKKLSGMAKPMRFLVDIHAEERFYNSVASAGLPMDQLFGALDDAAVSLGADLGAVRQGDKQGLHRLERFVAGCVKTARRDRARTSPTQHELIASSPPKQPFVPWQPKPFTIDPEL